MKTGLSREGAWGPGDSVTTLLVLLFQGEVTLHYNKLQADPKQGMSLDIGKPSCGGGVQGPHKARAASLRPCISTHMDVVSDSSDQADPKGLGGPRGAPPAAGPRNLSLVSPCPVFYPPSPSHLL